MKKLLHEPLVHFLLLGVLVFVAFRYLSPNSGSEPAQIVVTQAQIESLVTGFTRTWQRPPTNAEVEGLVREYIREEVCTREALALRLDQDDIVIRRRLRQKLEFISDSAASQTEPTDEQLQRYLLSHPDRFRAERRFTFHHVFVDPQKHAQTLSTDINRLMTQLRLSGGNADLSSMGDAFLLEQNFEAVSASEVTKQFGEKFAVKLGELPIGEWSGPIASGYGVHLVLVTERKDGGEPSLAEVRDAVKREWINKQRLDTTEKFYQALLSRYTIRIEDPRVAFAEFNQP